ncbi:MAG TPA: MGMT family protein [Clostridiaceae bacterium]
MEDFFTRVYKLVAQIPRGKVATYGQIGNLLGESRGARTVGWAMKAAPKGLKLPCHRVVNIKGELSPSFVFGDKDYQRELLIKEGISFNEKGFINMKKHLWMGSEDTNG